MPKVTLTNDAYERLDLPAYGLALDPGETVDELEADDDDIESLRANPHLKVEVAGEAEPDKSTASRKSAAKTKE